MARIAGVDLPRDKRVEIGLTYIYGIGPTLSKEILSKTGISSYFQKGNWFPFWRVNGSYHLSFLSL